MPTAAPRVAHEPLANDFGRRSLQNPAARARARRLQWYLVASGAAAVIVAAAAQVILPARGNVIVAWLTCVFLPGFIVSLIGVRGRSLRWLSLITALLYVEAILLSALYAIGMAFALLLPMIAIGLTQPYLGRQGRLVLYASAVVVAVVSVALVDLGAPPNPIGADYPGLAITAFTLVAAFGLGLTWYSAEQLNEALEDAETEIDARTAAERAARETAEALDRLIRASAVPTIVLDADGRVAVWNQAATRLFGEDEGQVLGRRLSLGGPPRNSEPDGAGTPGAAPVEVGDLPDQQDELVAYLLSSEQVEGEMASVRCAQGRRALVEIHSVARFDELGQRNGAIVQLVDVTERTALEAQIRRRQKMEAIGHVAGGIAHDINNTLTPVTGFAELIASEAAEQAIRDEAEMIAAAAHRAAELTTRLLGFARRAVLQPQVVEVARFLFDVRPTLEQALGERISLRIVDGAPRAACNVDPHELERALVHLATNAREAMPNGGTVTIATSRGEVQPEDATSARPAVTLTVSDTGPGIAPDIQERAWEPFFTTKERGRGTGLGLAMVYGFVTQSGGAVELRSAPGEGTTVEMRFPLVPLTEASSPGSAAIAAEAAGGTETILLLEDDPAIAELSRRLLAGLGYRVLVAPDGPEGVDLARTEHSQIDLVLADVIMPKMSGPDAARVIRDLHPEAAVLFVSGFTADVISPRGELPPGVDLLRKPFTPAELSRRVRHALDSRQPH